MTFQAIDRNLLPDPHLNEMHYSAQTASFPLDTPLTKFLHWSER